MNDTNTLIKAARAAAEAFLAALDEAGIISGSGGEQNVPKHDLADGPVEYDPLHDDPPFPTNPGPGAPEAHQKMAYVAYLGAIGRLNAEEGRGAAGAEITEFAKRAGYRNGAAVNGWNSRPGSPRAIELDESGGRFLNEEALSWINKDATRLGIKLVGEFATVPKPK
jgi:hypothetical protein